MLSPPIFLSTSSLIPKAHGNVISTNRKEKVCTSTLFVLLVLFFFPSLPSQGSLSLPRSFLSFLTLILVF